MIDIVHWCSTNSEFVMAALTLASVVDMSGIYKTKGRSA